MSTFGLSYALSSPSKIRSSIYYLIGSALIIAITLITMWFIHKPTTIQKQPERKNYMYKVGTVISFLALAIWFFFWGTQYGTKILHTAEKNNPLNEMVYSEGNTPEGNTPEGNTPEGNTPVDSPIKTPDTNYDEWYDEE